MNAGRARDFLRQVDAPRPAFSAFQYCATPSTAKVRKVAYLLPIFSCAFFQKWCGPVCGPALVPLSHAVWTIDHIYPVGARGFLDQLPAAPIALRRFRRHAHCSKKAGTKKESSAVHL